jgi:hypothetical protein
MLHVSSRKLLSASPAKPADAKSKRSRFISTLALGGAIALAAGNVAQAGYADARTSATSMPVKASGRVLRPPAKGNWELRSARQPGATRPYTGEVARQHLQSLSVDLAVLLAASAYVGAKHWDWGKTGFHFQKEGWFGKSTAYGGVDKLGHAWAGHVLSDYMTWRLRSLGYNSYEAAITGALISGAAFLAIEIGDGFSRYGASYEDLLASVAGVGFSFLRNTVPGLHEKVDFRMQYIPTGHGPALELGDYSGKKFVLAWKFAGFDATRDGPLRYLELHTGYYTRGYYDWERTAGIPQTRTPYVGIGLNLTELLLSHPSIRDTPPAAIARTVRTYIQAPYTYIASDNFH